MAVKKFRPTTPSRREMTMATFEEILNSLLEGLEKDPQADVNKVAQQCAKDMNINCDCNEIEQVNDLIQRFDGKYNELAAAKKETGTPTEGWFAKEISVIGKKAGMPENNQVMLIEEIKKASDKSFDDSLKIMEE